ncbi:MAG: hypothetical protein P8Y10_15350 [Gemmatimonadales bacterium]
MLQGTLDLGDANAAPRGKVRRGLQRVESSPSISIRRDGEPLEGILIHRQPLPSEALFVAERPAAHFGRIPLVQRFEHQYARATQQRAHHLEAGILRRGSDEDDRTGFHVR